MRSVAPEAPSSARIVTFAPAWRVSFEKRFVSAVSGTDTTAVPAGKTA